MFKIQISLNYKPNNKTTVEQKEDSYEEMTWHNPIHKTKERDRNRWTEMQM